MRQKLARHGLTLMLAAVALLAWQPRSAHALPAYAYRTGLACSKCHEPVFPRLNKFGWTFRSLGYRLPGEMNKALGPMEPAAEENGEKNPGHYEFQNTISIDIRGRWDNIHRQGSKTFDSPYFSTVSLHLSGPADKNFGYWGEAGLYSQSPSFNKTLGYQVLTAGSTDFTPWIRYYVGKSPKSFLYGKVGQIGIDGFEGNNSSLNTTATTFLTSTKVNGVSLGSQTGGSVGYVRNDDNVNLYVFNGANSITATSGVNARPGYNPDIALQYLHFIGKHSSSVQLLDYMGKISVDAMGSHWDKFNRLYVYANYRQPVGTHAFNLLTGFMDGTNHKLTTSGSTVNVGSSFNINSYFAELEWEHNYRFVPYLRYDKFHSDEYKKGAVYSGNPLKEQTGATLGAAYMANYNTRLNLDYTNSTPTGGPRVGTLRTAFWFMW